MSTIEVPTVIQVKSYETINRREFIDSNGHRYVEILAYAQVTPRTSERILKVRFEDGSI